MYFKLAVRNVKRQVGNYLIYFMTVTLTAALLFAINNILMGEQTRQITLTDPDFKTMIKAGVVIISMIIAFVLGYAASFMLRLRKREFGTYLTLGMTRWNIIRLFLAESALICMAAIVTGIFLGLFIYQGLMAVIMHLMEMKYVIAAYSASGLAFTVFLVSGIFVLSSITSAFYLKRVSIYDLIHAEKKTERLVRHPFLWVLVMMGALGAEAASGVGMKQLFEEVILDGGSSEGIAWLFTVLAAGTVLFHIGLARSSIYLLLKRKRFCNKGTNTFVLRQLSAALRTNSIMIGVLALLLTFAVIVSNVSFVQRAIDLEILDKEYPYDLIYTCDMSGYIMDGKSPSGVQGIGISDKKIKNVLKKYTAMNRRLPYATYTSGKSSLYLQTKWGSYEGLYDSFMKVSDFNALAVSNGIQPVKLNRQFVIVLNTPEAEQFTWGEMDLKLNGKKYTYRGVIENCPIFHYVPFFAVVPDHAVDGMEMDARFAAYQLEGKDYDVVSLEHELASLAKKVSKKRDNYEKCSFRLREYGRYERNSMNAILVAGSLFASLVLLFMAMAVLALKTLSGIEDDKNRYLVLSRLGAGEKEQKRALFCQTFSFFLMPFLFSVLVSIPTALIGENIMRLSGFEAVSGEIYLISGAAALVMTMIYVLYYSMTYIMAKRVIINS